MYAVDLWGSPPEENNDDCWTGADCPTLFEALCLFHSPWGKLTGFDMSKTSTAVIVLDGPGVHLVRRNPDFESTVDSLDDWRRELAMQNGMAFGCDGYNDTMGW